MSVRVETLRLDRTTWRISWHSDQADPVFRVYQDGLKVDTTTATSRIFSVAPGEALVVEIRDDDAPPEQASPGRFMLGWYPVSEAKEYRIDKRQGSRWIPLTVIPHDGRGFYRYRSRFLADCTLHTWRVVPVSGTGAEGEPLQLAELMVRNPDPPQQRFTYNPATREVTVNA